MDMSYQGIGRITTNPFIRDGKTLVSKVSASEDLERDILKAVDTIGGFNKFLDKGDKVLLKPNFNSADPPHASSDPQVLKAIVHLLYDEGAGIVTLA